MLSGSWENAEREMLNRRLLHQRQWDAIAATGKWGEVIEALAGLGEFALSGSWLG